MRGAVAGVLGLILVAAAGAQAPPAGARDITSTPEMQAMPTTPPEAAGPSDAESTAVAPPATVMRVFIDTLTGADTTAISELLAQALYQSKQVVVTENQSNASVTVRGEVVRELPPAPRSTSRRHSTTRQKSATAATTMAPSTADDMGTAEAAAPPGLNLNDFNLTALSSPEAAGTPVDLSQYRYRLNLEILDPAGDVVWMSGRGTQAQPFQTSQAAVTQTVQAMLSALARLAAASPATP